MLSDKDFIDLGLSDELVVAAGNQYDKASQVQAACIPHIIGRVPGQERRDLGPSIPLVQRANAICQAPAGQGKTATFCFSALQVLMDNMKNGQVQAVPQVLIISHNHNLSNQSRTAVQTYLEDAKLDRQGANNAVRVLPDNGKSFTEATINHEVDFLYDGRSSLTKMFGAKCPQIICGPPHQIYKVAKHHKDSA